MEFFDIAQREAWIKIPFQPPHLEQLVSRSNGHRDQGWSQAINEKQADGLPIETIPSLLSPVSIKESLLRPAVLSQVSMKRRDGEGP